MTRRFTYLSCLVALLVAGNKAAIATEADPALAEEGYLGELPVVLSVTRLAQSLADTPGAITIIDRETIHRSGARQITDILRLVPGFIVSGWNGANQVGLYQSALDNYGTRLQVFIDGRSVYSPLYLGGTHRGLMGVVLEDIERIEVLRGSNSAAYGANAFLGVINIITRNAADTHGGMVSATSGDQGINDSSARYGWGNENASFRISTSRQHDTGFKNIYDDKTVSQLHLRADLRPTGNDDVLFQAGGVRNNYGDGEAGSTGNARRNVEMDSQYLQLRWNRQLNTNEQMTVAASVDEENFTDTFPYTPVPGLSLSSSGRSVRHNLEFSHTIQSSESLRAVWGTNFRREEVWSPALFYQSQSLSQQQLRLFGNVEWRPFAQWVVNAGGLVEKNSIVDSTFSPRLMVNWHATPEHTFRAGVTKATRSPSLFELRSNVRYYNPTGGALLQISFAPLGNVKPEKLLSRELGYLGEFHKINMTVDVRVYEEAIGGLISKHDYVLPPPAPALSNKATDFINFFNPVIRGLEYQVRWKPLQETELMFNQAYTSVKSDEPNLEMSAPRVSYSAAWFQKLPANFDFAAILTHTGEMTWGNVDKRIDSYGQLDLRLAHSFLVGKTKAEIAVTTQAINGSHVEFTGAFSANRRAFATLRLEF